MSAAVAIALSPSTHAGVAGSKRETAASLSRARAPTVEQRTGMRLARQLSPKPFASPPAGVDPQEPALLLAQGAGRSSDAAGSAPPAGGPGATAPPAGGKWGLAPIRWHGLLATDLRAFSVAGQPRRMQLVDSANFIANSYIWQPWFAQLQGSLGLVRSKDHGGTGSLGSSGSASSHSVTGGGTVSLFPVSRFPFQGHFESSDSRASGQFTGNDTTTRKLGLRQSFRTVDGNTNYNASFDRNSLNSDSFGRDTVDVLTGGMSRSFGLHGLELNANHTRNTRSRSDESSEFTRLGARHSYRPQPLLSVESLASYSGSNLKLASGSGLNQTRSQFLQLNSFGSWRPEEDHPLYLTGSARYFQSMADGGGASGDVRSLGVNVAGLYTYNRNLSGSASAGLAQTQTSASAGGLITTQGLGLTYVADPRRFGEFTYSVNAGATAANQTGLQGGRYSLGGTAGHGLTRNYLLTPQQTVTLNVNQNLGTVYDSVAQSTQSLGHNASLAWRLASGQSMTAYSALSFGDSRTQGQNSSHFQLVNFQASGQLQMSRYGFGSANLTVQGTRQDAPSTPATGFNLNSNGGFSYQHLQAFGIPRLRYFATYNRNDQQLSTRLQGDLNAPREQMSQSFEQRLEYNVGKLEFRLSFRLADIDGKKNALLFLRISRQLGDR